MGIDDADKDSIFLKDSSVGKQLPEEKILLEAIAPPKKPKRKKEKKQPFKKLKPKENLREVVETDLFQKAFGNKKTEKKHHFLAPFQINYRGKSRVLVQKNSKDTFFQAQIFLQQIQPMLSPEKYDSLSNSVNEEGFLSISSLVDLGYKAWFDDKNLALSFHVPPEFRRHQSKSLNRGLNLYFNLALGS